MQILQIFIISIFLSVNSFLDFKTFPIVEIFTLDGKKASTADYIGQGQPTIISFWATWCAPCKRELDTVAELYPEWKEKYNVQILAITTDNARGLRKVPGMVSAKGWEFTVLADKNQALQESLSFQTIPQTFVVDGQGNIVYEHTGYAPGDEEELEEVIKGLSVK